MNKSIALVFFCFLPSWYYAQVLRVNGSQFLEKKSMPSAGLVSAPALQSLRLDEGKFWINGNLIQAQELPLKLQSQLQERDFYASFQGIQAIELVLEGKTYLVKPGRISDITKICSSGKTETHDQAYMERLSREEPETFEALSREAELNRKTLSLSKAYISSADPRKKAELRAELRMALEQLFDLNIRNQEQELFFLENQIAIRKEELKIKQADKARQVARNLNELTELK